MEFFHNPQEIKALQELKLYFEYIFMMQDFKSIHLSNVLFNGIVMWGTSERTDTKCYPN